MNINPMEIMKMKGELDAFNARHPKLKMFLNDAVSRVDTGAVVELSITSASGEKIRTNIRVTEEDKALFCLINKLVLSQK